MSLTIHTTWTQHRMCGKHFMHILEATYLQWGLHILFTSESCLLYSDLLIALMSRAGFVFYFRSHRFPCSPLLFNFSSQAERMFQVHNVHVLLMWSFHNRGLIVRNVPIVPSSPHHRTAFGSLHPGSVWGASAGH